MPAEASRFLQRQPLLEGESTPLPDQLSTSLRIFCVNACPASQKSCPLRAAGGLRRLPPEESANGSGGPHRGDAHRNNRIPSVSRFSAIRWFPTPLPGQALCRRSAPWYTAAPARGTPGRPPRLNRAAGRAPTRPDPLGHLQPRVVPSTPAPRARTLRIPGSTFSRCRVTSRWSSIRGPRRPAFMAGLPRPATSTAPPRQQGERSPDTPGPPDGRRPPTAARSRRCPG